MRFRKNPTTRLAAVVTGLLARVAGTACLDAGHQLLLARRWLGTRGFLDATLHGVEL